MRLAFYGASKTWEAKKISTMSRSSVLEEILTIKRNTFACSFFGYVPSRAVRLYVEPSFLVQIWHNTTHDKKVFTNSTFCDII